MSSHTKEEIRSAVASPTPPITSDDAELLAAGYTPSMPRRFSKLAAFSTSFDLLATWLAMSASLGVALTEASSAGVIWPLIIAAVFTAILSAGIAELASAFPVSGAQYYWTYMVSDEASAPFASFVAGWMSVFGWWLAMSAVCNLIAGMILAMAVFCHPTYVIDAWHQYLVYVGIIWLVVAANTLGARFIPWLTKIMMVVSVLVVLSTLLALLICSRDHYPSAAWIFGDTTNNSGWPSNGFPFVLAIMNAIFSFAGIDCAAHLAEEVPSPGKHIPKCLLWPILLGISVAWPLAVALMSSIRDLEAVVSTPTGFPLIEIFFQATGSRAAAIVLMALFTLCFFCGCSIANGTTNSRMVWSISRDNALPFSNIWARIDPIYKVPANALCLCAIVAMLYGLIFIGSANVFSSMINASVIFLQTPLAIPQVIMIWRGRSKVLPPRYFAIPEPWGTAVNIIAVAYVAFTNVLGCIPISRPVTLENMNWISVVAVGIVVFVIALWLLSKRAVFMGPRVDVELMKARREEALGLTSTVHGDNRTGRDPHMEKGCEHDLRGA